MPADRPDSAGRERFAGVRGVVSRHRAPILRTLAGLALGLAALFHVVGDGVPPSPDPGWRGWAVDHLHTLVWLVLAVACWLAASPRPAGRRWASRVSLLALALYVTFRLVLHGVV
ncbi:hypothetical protein [Micromonospora cathayae]|uniref:Uncharacterized protein n=1 Tax=Micromonospora cathayae TaxID=3028804 RepID=A0ABY7ZXH5_9ACTN|nr:hypothetical protein [Micromonospora sp. HUAS 3]WDZ87802.1 hypothetical protein PVK37_16040 [Micromonospora sp. HUAS 3]